MHLQPRRPVSVPLQDQQAVVPAVLPVRVLCMTTVDHVNNTCVVVGAGSTWSP